MQISISKKFVRGNLRKIVGLSQTCRNPLLSFAFVRDAPTSTSTTGGCAVAGDTTKHKKLIGKLPVARLSFRTEKKKKLVSGNSSCKSQRKVMQNTWNNCVV